MEIFKADVAIIGAGGAGLRAAIAVAEADPGLSIALISKVYPMRSHTVAAEGGAAAVTQAHDSLEEHFHDTVAGGDWLCEQDVVQHFVSQAHEEMVQMEHWGCPWSRLPDGHANVRAFGGMKIERTWFAADKTGFHMLHTLFQTSIRYPSIRRFDEHFCVDLLVDEGRAQGVVTIEVATNGPFAVSMGGWRAPMGITLVADLLSSMLLTVSLVTVLGVFVYAIGPPRADHLVLRAMRAYESASGWTWPQAKVLETLSKL